MKEVHETIVLNATDHEFDGNYVRKVDHDREIRALLKAIWIASGAAVLAIACAFFGGLATGRAIQRENPTQYVTTTEPQVHTVEHVQPFEVPDTYCPREDSCRYAWVDPDHDGFGEAQLVEVTP